MKKIFYRVKDGDCLMSVSNSFNAPIFDIILDNGLKKEIEPGDVLIINLTSNYYFVKATDTLLSVSQKFGLTPEKLSFINGGITYLFYGLIIRI